MQVALEANEPGEKRSRVNGTEPTEQHLGSASFGPRTQEESPTAPLAHTPRFPCTVKQCA